MAQSLINFVGEDVRSLTICDLRGGSELIRVSLPRLLLQSVLPKTLPSNCGCLGSFIKTSEWLYDFLSGQSHRLPSAARVIILPQTLVIATQSSWMPNRVGESLTARTMFPSLNCHCHSEPSALSAVIILQLTPTARQPFSFPTRKMPVPIVWLLFSSQYRLSTHKVPSARTKAVASSSARDAVCETTSS